MCGDLNGWMQHFIIMNKDEVLSNEIQEAQEAQEVQGVGYGSHLGSVGTRGVAQSDWTGVQSKFRLDLWVDIAKRWYSSQRAKAIIGGVVAV